MLDINKKTLQTHPSLLPLRMALIAAESGVPPRPPRPPRMDSNEQRAILLIENVKAEYKKQQFVLNFHDIPSPYYPGIKQLAVCVDQL